MSMREPRGLQFRDAVAEGTSYAACCVGRRAGVMLVVTIVLGSPSDLERRLERLDFE
jgi:hypothetical protein